MNNNFDVIVVGGGHAGTEAALACVRLGASIILITHKMDTLGEMSCNPAIGGIGKSHLVKEIDALDGYMAHAADLAGIQFRTLNARKGPAVRATRAQTDRLLYKQAIRAFLESQKHLNIFEDAIDDLIIEKDTIKGVITQTGIKFLAQAVILTPGTFLKGLIHVGEQHYEAGRINDPSSIKLAEKLRSLPFRVARLKTGTPARLDGRTINFEILQEQPGDYPTPVFSYLGKKEEHPQQVSCYITHTNEKTHEIIQKALHRSPLFSGKIKGVGPRYCPSIEDKIIRFSDKTSHQIFIEPEGLTVHEYYPNGISTSLPKDVQDAFIRSIKGFEDVAITQYGYAIEYDFFDPRDLKSSLETKAISGLFFAGQINGTTGYEEAAAQGLIAGLNAVQLIRDEDPWVPRRDQGYIGVLIDDLITKGTNEPYRMFTSRAEYRLLLREDNADIRLTEIGKKLGLVQEKRWQVFCDKQEKVESEKQRLKSIWIRPNTKSGGRLEKFLKQTLSREYNLIELLKRPELSYVDLMNIIEEDYLDDMTVIQQLEIEERYAGYIERQKEAVEKHKRCESQRIPKDFDYQTVKGLSAEVFQKLERMRPETIGIASRIPGITPAAISILLIYLKKYGAT